MPRAGGGPYREGAVDRGTNRPGKASPGKRPKTSGGGTYPFVRWSAAYLRHQAAIPHSPHLGLRAMQT